MEIQKKLQKPKQSLKVKRIKISDLKLYFWTIVMKILSHK